MTMLTLLLRAGGQRYGLRASRVEEVSPLLALRPVPRAPGWIAGIAAYRGAGAPVVDLTALLCGSPARRLLSTRIAFVVHHGPGGSAEIRPRMLGILAEEVTEAVLFRPDDFSDPGLVIPNTPYLGQIAFDASGTIQCLEPEALLGEELAAMLYAEPSGGPA